MVVKFFANKQGGSERAIDYLLNEREMQRTARTLQGDPNITRKIIRSIDRKQKVAVGCLSFEESNIPEDDKYILMDEFEKMLLPTMQGRYNILWVEHTDKGRLELNFVIPKMDLPTGKALNPYYHKADVTRKELFEDKWNLIKDYSSAKDPSKARTLNTSTKQHYLSKDYDELDKLLHQLVADGTLQNRDQLIETLKEQVEVTRISYESISVKLPEHKKAKRFKGGIYAQEFRSLGSLSAISQGAREAIEHYNNRDTQAELRAVEQELSEHIRYKAEQLRNEYHGRAVQNHKPTIESQKHSANYLMHDDIGNHQHRSNMVLDEPRDQIASDVASSTRDALRGQKRQIYRESKRSVDISQQNSRSRSKNYQDKELNNDSIGEATLRRIREQREAQQRALQILETQRNAVYRKAGDCYLKVQGRNRKDEANVRSFTQYIASGYARIKTALREAYSKIELKLSHIARETKKVIKQMR